VLECTFIVVLVGSRLVFQQVVRKIVDGGVHCCGYSEDVNLQLGWFANDS